MDRFGAGGGPVPEAEVQLGAKAKRSEVIDARMGLLPPGVVELYEQGSGTRGEFSTGHGVGPEYDGDYVPGDIDGGPRGPAGSPHAVGAGKPPIRGAGGHPEAIIGADVDKGAGFCIGGVGKGRVLDDITREGPRVGVYAGELLNQGDARLLIVLSHQGEVTVGVLIPHQVGVQGIDGDRDEALEAGEVMQSRQGAAEYIVVVVGVGVLEPGKDDLTLTQAGAVGGADAVGGGDDVGVGCREGDNALPNQGLRIAIPDDGCQFVRAEGKTDDIDARAAGPPGGGHGYRPCICAVDGVGPGATVVMGVVAADAVDRVLAVEDIDPGAVGGDGARTVTVGGDQGPGGEVGGVIDQVEGEDVRKAGNKGGDLLLVVEAGADHPDAVYAALAIDGDAVMAVGLAAGVESLPGGAADAPLEVLDLGLDVGLAVPLLLSGLEGCG